MQSSPEADNGIFFANVYAVLWYSVVIVSLIDIYIYAESHQEVSTDLIAGQAMRYIISLSSHACDHTKTRNKGPNCKMESYL
jgi:hypothetical protein